MDFTCGCWSVVVINGKWPHVAWLSCSFATGYTTDLFSWNWKRKQVKIGKGIAFWIALSLLMFSHKNYKNGISQKFSRSLVISHSQFCKSFWSSEWWILPADDDPWLSLLGNDLVLRGFLVRLQPVTLQISSRGTEKENRSKLARCCFLNCVISTNIFKQKV